MRMVLVRHGEAEPSARSDAERALTPRGRRQAQLTGAWLLETVGAAAAPRLLASPYRRAQETGHELAGLLGVALQTVQAITPDDDPRRALAAIEAAAAGADVVVVVSHMPLVGGLAAWLEEGVLSAGRGFGLAEARVLEMIEPGPGLASARDGFLPGLGV